MKKYNPQIIAAIVLIMIASELSNIIFREIFHNVPFWLNVSKLCILVISAVAFLFIKKLKHLFKFAIVLATMVSFSIFYNHSYITSFFNSESFVGSISTNISYKIINILLLIIVFIIVSKHPKNFYLTFGNLSIKAEEIKWLGIKGETISWLKLSLYSAFFISTVTFFLTLFTVTGFKIPERIFLLPKYLPVILLFAAVNSFAEGIMCRNAILGSLRNTISKKYTLLISGIFFGLLHYYGAPAGVTGVIMSALLGWYLSRSMYETNGLLSAWIIHFFTDVAVFTSLFLFGNLTIN